MFERRFTMRHVIKKFPELEDDYSPVEEHFGVPWKIKARRVGDWFDLFLLCDREEDTARPWSIDIDLVLRVTSGRTQLVQIMDDCEYTFDESWGFTEMCKWDEMIKNHMIDDAVTVECEASIKKMTGFAQKRSMDFREPKGHLTDVVFKIGETEKFNVSKVFLSTLSPYFNALFFGGFTESKKSEISLENVDPESFQSFLETAHGVACLTSENVENVLKLADRFDVKSVRDRCEEFVFYTDQITDVDAFRMSEVYKLPIVQKECLERVRTTEHIEEILSAGVSEFSHATLVNLLQLSVSISNRHLPESSDSNGILSVTPNNIAQ